MKRRCLGVIRLKVQATVVDRPCDDFAALSFCITGHDRGLSAECVIDLPPIYLLRGRISDFRVRQRLAARQLTERLSKPETFASLVGYGPFVSPNALWVDVLSIWDGCLTFTDRET